MAPSTNAESTFEYILLVLKHTDLPRSDWAAVAVESSLSNANKAYVFLLFFLLSCTLAFLLAYRIMSLNTLLDIPSIGS